MCAAINVKSEKLTTHKSPALGPQLAHGAHGDFHNPRDHRSQRLNTCENVFSTGLGAL